MRRSKDLSSLSQKYYCLHKQNMHPIELLLLLEANLFRLSVVSCVSQYRPAVLDIALYLVLEYRLVEYSTRHYLTYSSGIFVMPSLEPNLYV